VNDYWMKHGRPDRLVMSFHGLPRFSLDRGDPYHCECHKSARLIAAELGWDDGRALVTFQSRFGKAEWLQPYTEPHPGGSWAAEGAGRVDVICPGFAADCLETLEEIALECRDAFLGAGGQAYHYIPCLNERPDWIAALRDLVSAHLSGWQLAATADPQAKQRAAALGAKS
jgi:ferrochelatase